MRLEDFKSMLVSCKPCGTCGAGRGPNNPFMTGAAPVQRCPSLERFKFLSYSPRGRRYLARMIAFEDFPINHDLVKVFYACTLCKMCEEVCFLPFTDIFLAVREQIVRQGYALEPHKASARIIESKHNPCNMKHEKRTAWLTEKIPEKANTIYFVGCIPSYLEIQIAKNTARVLKVADIEFGLIDEWCCGAPLLATGQRTLFKKLAEHNVNAIETAGAENVIFSCPACYEAFKMHYPKVIRGRMHFDVLHTVEFFDRLLEEGRLEPKHEIAETVTYHDPCHLGRYLGVYDAPRRILKKIPGLKLIEMPRNRSYSWCCGSNAGVKEAFPEFALWVALERLREAEETKAKAIVSTCPYCRKNFSDAVRVANKALKVYDITELLSIAIGN